MIYYNVLTIQLHKLYNEPDRLQQVKNNETKFTGIAKQINIFILVKYNYPLIYTRIFKRNIEHLYISLTIMNGDHLRTYLPSELHPKEEKNEQNHPPSED